MSDVQKKGKRLDYYSELFIQLADRVERWLIRIAISLLILFVLSQLLLEIPEVRHAVTRIDRLEGVPAGP